MNVADMIVAGVMVGAAAVTGGATAGSNQTIVTSDSSASVQVTNVINGNNEGGTSYTIIEKTVDGVTTREEETKTFEPGEPIYVETWAEAVSGGQEVSGSSDASSVVAEAAALEISAEASTTADIASSTDFGISIVSSIGSFVKETFANLVEGFLNFWN